MRPRPTGLPYLADQAARLGGLPDLPCKHDEIKIRDYMERQVTPPRRVTSPTWGPPPPCKQALIIISLTAYWKLFWQLKTAAFRHEHPRWQKIFFKQDNEHSLWLTKSKLVQKVFSFLLRTRCEQIKPSEPGYQQINKQTNQISKQQHLIGLKNTCPSVFVLGIYGCPFGYQKLYSFCMTFLQTKNKRKRQNTLYDDHLFIIYIISVKLIKTTRH